MKEFLFSLINFLILFGVLFFLTRKMIRRMFSGRRDRIADDLQTAADSEREAERLSADIADANAKAAAEKEAQLRQAHDRAAENSEAAADARAQETEQVRLNAAQSEAQLRADMENRVASHTIRLVADEAAQILRGDEYSEARQGLTDSFIQQIKDLVAAMPSDILNMNELKKLDISISSAEPLSDEEMKKLTQILCETFISCPAIRSMTARSPTSSTA